MSTRRGGRYGSNNAELCPVCFKVLTTRFGAALGSFLTCLFFAGVAAWERKSK